jgi:hypothetical protein
MPMPVVQTVCPLAVATVCRISAKPVTMGSLIRGQSPMPVAPIALYRFAETTFLMSWPARVVTMATIWMETDVPATVFLSPVVTI